MKTIKVELSVKSIEDAITELEKTRKELSTKAQTLVDRLTADGIQVANAWVRAGQGDNQRASVGYEYNSYGEIMKAYIYLEGEDAIFVEFGAGIAYNTGTQHPLAGQFGYGPGTYPSKNPPNKAINPGYWHHHRGQLSLGTEATMPIYRASESVRNNLIKTAIDVFMKG